MKRNLFFILTIIMGVTTVMAQTVLDFEELSLEPESHWNGSDLSGSFTSNYASFFNNYDQQYGMWDGFAYTNETDNSTFDWTNQYSSASGNGVYSSSNYAVSFVGSDWMGDYSPIPTVIKFDPETMPESIPGMYLSLNANSSLYMADGDYYSNQKHYLTLRINAYSTTEYYAVSKDIILADYRFSNAEDGFKFDTWQYVDLTWAEGTDSLTFILLSSDSGEYGLNTPAYFCIDNIGETVPTGIPQLETDVQDTYSISSGESTQLSALASGGVQPYSFQWSSEYGLDDYTSQTPMASPTATTTYNVTITDALGNESASSTTVFVGTTSVAQSQFAEFSYYFDESNILKIENSEKISNVCIFDITGKQLFNQNLDDYSSEVDFSIWSDAIYIMKVQVENIVKSYKLVR
ncbi:MAG: DUF4465 domain-containing protein [Bacteroidales bacterium]|nr:DUF4465 domain-containing protein [Bacteroidales bacterium]